MYQRCEKCGRRYSDEFCSTVCPHKGIGHCAVCDCVICLCNSDTCRDWERASNNHETPNLGIFESDHPEMQDEVANVRDSLNKT